jgi:hypothetical protein
MTPTSPVDRYLMQHPRSLTPAQQQHLASACRRTSVHRVATVLGMSRDVVARLAGGLPATAGSVAIALQGLPRLDAALAPDGPAPPHAA